MAQLWCVHVLGPDTLIAQPDKETAERRAAEWNKSVGKLLADAGPYAPRISMVVEPWPYDAAGHDEEIKRHGGEPADIC